ncbi:hypothetical protein O6H91_06G063200 [Diphasiastrum complanatum]|uniref:Uncharacterized protein n=1 Tax=Diphasiastrum complanatum TaxID=34168 RepID=A0ACC2DEP7_DIPCM|nr:hypothetical protein O6H91_06G063200 [Diphasiastrum complanatum]
MSNRYYHHFKLYQYAFCATYILKLETREYDLLDLPPILPPLKEAFTEEEWNIEQARVERLKEEEAKKLAEQQLVEEVARQASIDKAYHALMSDEMTRKITEIADQQIDCLRKEFQVLLQQQEQKISEKIVSIIMKEKSK